MGNAKFCIQGSLVQPEFWGKMEEAGAQGESGQWPDRSETIQCSAGQPLPQHKILKQAKTISEHAPLPAADSYLTFTASAAN
jgi:hypothetical protein